MPRTLTVTAKYGYREYFVYIFGILYSVLLTTEHKEGKRIFMCAL
jgi:hypothetical protein